jgi:hypothetical protein
MLNFRNLKHSLPSPTGINLKGQAHEIFNLRIFHESNLARSPIIVLKYFRIWFRFRGEEAFPEKVKACFFKIFENWVH